MELFYAIYPSTQSSNPYVHPSVHHIHPICNPPGECYEAQRDMQFDSSSAHARLAEGGRTAWSSVVVVYGKRIEARYWYDGNNLNNAKEDAAEAALHWLSNSSGLSSGW
ncbi:hypothetical protein F5X98DRAFT_371290 [Xylaria grammica]|nr:hypothetical protein F5X98DRAFT_371290 [Xylaria grammica]